MNKIKNNKIKGIPKTHSVLRINLPYFNFVDQQMFAFNEQLVVFNGTFNHI